MARYYQSSKSRVLENERDEALRSLHVLFIDGTEEVDAFALVSSGCQEQEGSRCGRQCTAEPRGQLEEDAPNQE